MERGQHGQHGGFANHPKTGYLSRPLGKRRVLSPLSGHICGPPNKLWGWQGAIVKIRFQHGLKAEYEARHNPVRICLLHDLKLRLTIHASITLEATGLSHMEAKTLIFKGFTHKRLAVGALVALHRGLISRDVGVVSGEELWNAFEQPEW